MNRFFFVHIPKTAGTSFRSSLAETNSLIHLDYGMYSGVTSKEVIQYVYNESDYYEYSLFSERYFLSLAGHVNAGKYINLFTSQRTITFLREPIDRLVSEYNHFVNHNGYTKSFEEFYSNEHFVNRLTKMTSNIDIELFLFVGISERYEESLASINKLLSCNIPIKSENITVNKRIVKENIAKYDIDKILHLNKRDIELYEKAKLVFSKKIRKINNNTPVTFAKITLLNNKCITGWAFDYLEDNPSSISVFINDIDCGLVVAKALNKNLCWLGPPRNGYIGFKFDANIFKGDKVSVLDMYGNILDEKVF